MDSLSPAKIEKIPTVLGTTIEMPVPGVAEFIVEGRLFDWSRSLSRRRIQLFFILRDTTSKTTTYGAARFLYTALPDQGLNKRREALAGLQSIGEPSLRLIQRMQR